MLRFSWPWMIPLFPHTCRTCSVAGFARYVDDGDAPFRFDVFDGVEARYPREVLDAVHASTSQLASRFSVVSILFLMVYLLMAWRQIAIGASGKVAAFPEALPESCLLGVGAVLCLRMTASDSLFETNLSDLGICLAPTERFQESCGWEKPGGNYLKSPTKTRRARSVDGLKNTRNEN